jgi:rod shape-determining protein MreD
MSTLRRVVTAIFIVFTVAVQSAVIARWNLPGGTPDLVLVVVVAFAVKQQATRATLLGFGAGLLLDATPPAAGLLGVSALTLAVVAFAASQLRTDISRSPFGPLVFLSAAAAANVFLHALLGGLLGDPSASWSRAPLAALSGAFYCALLGSLVVPLVRWLLRFLMPAPTVFLRR